MADWTTLPHSGIFSLNDEQRKWPWFLGGYMAIIGIYGLLWLISVPLGLTLFFVALLLPFRSAGHA